MPCSVSACFRSARTNSGAWPRWTGCCGRAGCSSSPTSTVATAAAPRNCLSRALPLAAITDTLTRTGYSLLLVRDRSDLLKQLAGQIIFSCGSLEQFWALFMDPDNARRTACTLAGARLGYYALVAVKGAHHG